jgi:hypothetical protein
VRLLADVVARLDAHHHELAVLVRRVDLAEVPVLAVSSMMFGFAMLVSSAADEHARRGSVHGRARLEA